MSGMVPQRNLSPYFLFLKIILNSKQTTAHTIPAEAATEYRETSAALFWCNPSLAAPSYGAPSAV